MIRSKIVNKKYYKWHQNLTGYIILIILIVILSILALVLGVVVELTSTERMVSLIIVGSLLLICLVFFIIIFIHGIKIAIYVDDDKIWQTVKGVKYEWHWEEMNSCVISWRRYKKIIPIDFYFPTVIIITKLEYKKLQFSSVLFRPKILYKLCSNKKIKQQLEKYLSDDFLQKIKSDNLD